MTQESVAPGYDSLVLNDRVHTSLYVDPAIFEAEMDRIFNSTWVWVAHASEIPAAGNFKMSHVGRQPVIVTRDNEGRVHVLLNRCRHRAGSVCEERKGKTSVFVCRTRAIKDRICGLRIPFCNINQIMEKRLPGKGQAFSVLKNL